MPFSLSLSCYHFYKFSSTKSLELCKRNESTEEVFLGLRSTHSLGIFLQSLNLIPWSRAWQSLHGFQEEFCLNKRDEIRSRKEEHTTVSAEVLPHQKGQADTGSAEETNISSIDKCLIGHFENLMSCMQMQMFEELFTV